MKPLSSHLVGTTTNLDRPKDLRDAAEKLEAVMVKKLLETSGAFEIKGTGGGTHSDLFTHAVSQAIARGGGFGLAEALMRDVGDESAKNSTPGAMRPTGLPNLQGRGPNDPALFNAAQDLLVPEATRISSDFGYRVHPIHGDVRHHDGIDIAAPKGSAITAPKAGVVAQVENHEGGYGNFLVLDHGDGTRTLYAHAETIDVKVGEKVKMGDKLATVGSTGDSTGAHLHFEVQRRKTPIDPGSALKKYGNDPK